MTIVIRTRALAGTELNFDLWSDSALFQREWGDGRRRAGAQESQRSDNYKWEERVWSMGTNLPGFADWGLSKLGSYSQQGLGGRARSFLMCWLEQSVHLAALSFLKQAYIYKQLLSNDTMPPNLGSLK